MKQLKTLFAAGCTLFALSCQKSNVTDTASPNRSSGARSKAVQSYVILSRTNSVSQQLLAQATAAGTVTASLPELGIILANSTDPAFAANLKKLSEVQNVVPDIRMNWLPSEELKTSSRVVTESDIHAEAQQTGEPSKDATLYTSAGLGLSGTNPYVPWQWSLQAVNAKEAFTHGYKGSGATVAVLDAGFHLENPDLSPNIADAVSFVPTEPAQAGAAWSHGTHVAGIVAAADNNWGVSGIAPAARLLLVKVLDDEGNGSFGWLIEGVYYAATHGANIINMSLGATISRDGKFTDADGNPDHDAKSIQDLIVALNRAFQFAKANDVLSIAAAGNEGEYITGQGQGSHYPSACADVLAVAATGPINWVLDTYPQYYSASFYTPASFTNYGTSLISFAAPGGNISDKSYGNVVSFGSGSTGYIQLPIYGFDFVLSDATTTGLIWAAGTSQATPAVSGVAALIAGKYNGKISPAQLTSKLKASSTDLGPSGRDAYYGWGYVNAGAAVQQ